MALVYKRKSDSTGETFIQYTNLFGIPARADQAVLDELTYKIAQIARLCQDNGLKLMKEFCQNLNIEMNYNSNAIEGYPGPTQKRLFPDSSTVTLREMDDLVGHGKAFENVRNRIQSKRLITTDDILGIHKLVLHYHQAGGRIEERTNMFR